MRKVIKKETHTKEKELRHNTVSRPNFQTGASSSKIRTIISRFEKYIRDFNYSFLNSIKIGCDFFDKLKE